MKSMRIPTNQIELHVQDHEGGGDAVLFLHFSGANLMMWQRVVPDVRDRYRVILIDLRGHGQSDRPATGYHMDTMARDVAGVMDHLGLDRAHVIGSSLGAEVGLSLAAGHPERVRTLVCDGALASAYGPYGTWEGSEAAFEAHVTEQLTRLREAEETRYPSVEALVADRRAFFEPYGWWNAYHEAMVRHGAYEVAGGQVVKDFGPQAMADYMAHYFHARFEDYYPRVTCPILMLADRDLDDERERAAMRGLRDLAPRAEIAEVPGWAHPYCWLLDPDPAIQAVLRFLDAVPR
jgi:2-succinyl-6-hydroxy-2,4-cyclohexadiene-1-carboxylate synthase